MLSNHTLLGRLARLPLRAIPHGAVMPVLRGPNRGYRWISGSLTHGCWIGIYEKRNAAFVAGFIKEGMTVYDVGANAGYFTLMFSRLVGSTGKVVAFEPEPNNVAALKAHLSINGIRNVEVVDAAVSNEAGVALFDGSRSTGCLSSHGGLSVKTVRLDDFPVPDFVKMDIEGGETSAILGADKTLSARRTAWFVELHSADAGRIVKARLRDNRYRVQEFGSGWIVALAS